jgi:hypothetical protein
MSDLLSRIKEIYSKYGVSSLEPKFVMIKEDLRERKSEACNHELEGHFGVYLGDFYYPSLLNINLGEADESERLYDAFFVHPEEYGEESEFRIANPLIIADTGEFIWGIESFWGLLPEIRLRDVHALEGVFDSNNVLEKLELALQAESSYAQK